MSLLRFGRYECTTVQMVLHVCVPLLPFVVRHGYCKVYAAHGVRNKRACAERKTIVLRGHVRTSDLCVIHAPRYCYSIGEHKCHDKCLKGNYVL